MKATPSALKLSSFRLSYIRQIQNGRKTSASRCRVTRTRMSEGTLFSDWAIWRESTVSSIRNVPFRSSSQLWQIMTRMSLARPNQPQTTSHTFLVGRSHLDRSSLIRTVHSLCGPFMAIFATSSSRCSFIVAT
nr:putative integron gene cassette protein [uncultured bacterium]